MSNYDGFFPPSHLSREWPKPIFDYSLLQRCHPTPPPSTPWAIFPSLHPVTIHPFFTHVPRIISSCHLLYQLLRTRCLSCLVWGGKILNLHWLILPGRLILCLHSDKQGGLAPCELPLGNSPCLAKTHVCCFFKWLTFFRVGAESLKKITVIQFLLWLSLQELFFPVIGGCSDVLVHLSWEISGVVFFFLWLRSFLTQKKGNDWKLCEIIMGIIRLNLSKAKKTKNTKKTSGPLKQRRGENNIRDSVYRLCLQQRDQLRKILHSSKKQFFSII